MAGPTSVTEPWILNQGARPRRAQALYQVQNLVKPIQACKDESLRTEELDREGVRGLQGVGNRDCLSLLAGGDLLCSNLLAVP